MAWLSSQTLYVTSLSWAWLELYIIPKIKYVEFPCLRDKAHLSRLAILTTFGVFPPFSLCPLKGFLSRCEWSTWAWQPATIATAILRLGTAPVFAIWT